MCMSLCMPSMLEDSQSPRATSRADECYAASLILEPRENANWSLMKERAKRVGQLTRNIRGMVIMICYWSDDANVENFCRATIFVQHARHLAKVHFTGHFVSNFAKTWHFFSLSLLLFCFFVTSCIVMIFPESSNHRFIIDVKTIRFLYRS